MLRKVQHVFLVPVMVMIAGLIGACSKDKDNVVTIIPDDTNAPDTTILRTAFYPDSATGFLYYSLENDSIVNPVYANTDFWDIKFEHVNVDSVAQTFDKQVDILLNSSTINPAGRTLGLVLDQPFDQVSQVPDNSQFRVDSVNFSHRIFNMDGVSTSSLVTYVFANHTLLPKAEKTVIIKTRSGKYVKLQLINLYKGTPTNPAYPYDIGYYTFRYTRNDGKRLK